MMVGAGIFLLKNGDQTMGKFTVLYQLMINMFIFKNSSNQRKDTKILFSDWLIQFL
jgi:hypothetical protein